MGGATLNDSLTATCKILLSPMESCTKTDFLCTLIIIKASRTVQRVINFIVIL